MFQLIISSVSKKIYEGEVESATCPGSDGELTILSQHSSLITTLKEGKITVRENKDKEAQTFEVRRGLLEVGHNRATILI